MFFSDDRLIRQFYWVMVIADHRVLCTHIPTVRGIKKLSATGAGTDADTGTDTGAIDNT